MSEYAFSPYEDAGPGNGADDPIRRDAANPAESCVADIHCSICRNCHRHRQTHLRFEGGRALLALPRHQVEAGVVIERAWFEIPDAAFPLDASGGAARFRRHRLKVRAVELGVMCLSLR